MAPVSGGSFPQDCAYAVLAPTTGRPELSTSFSAVTSLRHDRSRTRRTAFFDRYARSNYDSKTRNAAGLLGFGFAPAAPGASDALAFTTSPILLGNNPMIIGASPIWTPLRDLDIGIEGESIRTALYSGVTPDFSRDPPRYVNAQDAARFRLRVQPDF